MRWPTTKSSSMAATTSSVATARPTFGRGSRKCRRSSSRRRAHQRAGDGAGFLFTLACIRGPIRTPSTSSSRRPTTSSRPSTKRATCRVAVRCTFSALNTKYPFRAERLTEKPIVKGPQTALVVGATGEDIYTDKFGRIKVHFYWDRYGKRDDQSSCWIRVSQNWGGKGWGGMFIPHVGQEVIVHVRGRRSGSADHYRRASTTPRTCRRWSCRGARPRASSATTATITFAWKARQVASKSICSRLTRRRPSPSVRQIREKEGIHNGEGLDVECRRNSQGANRRVARHDR